MTHSELVAYARRWLVGSCRCSVVVTELATSGAEVPDAIGWAGNGVSHLVECKASRGDFRRDLKKSFRRMPDRGMGSKRWYMTPKGLLSSDEVPQGWGLIEVSPGGQVRRVKYAVPVENDAHKEVLTLLSLIRRLDIATGPHISVRAYDYRTQCTAGVTVDPIE